MIDNPFIGLIKEIKGMTQSEPSSLTGVVLSTSPLKIAYSGIELTGEDLLVNSQLLQPVENGEPILKSGDTVLVIDNDQTYIIVCPLIGGENSE